VFAKLNPGVKYVQGMNEVIAVIYFCFWHFDNDNPHLIKYLESDLFFCFNNVMTEIRDGFLRTLDMEPTGIRGKIHQFAEIMKKVDG
jgi:hypothetical protein